MDIKHCVEELCQKFPNGIKVATPLGIGKPIEVLNELYRRAKSDPNFELKIFTALSLNPPHAKGDLGRRFFEPFAERQWGKNYPDLEYARDAEDNQLPPNVTVHEFYFRAGAALKSEHLQRNYQSLNYTHVGQNLFEADIQLVVQLVARRGDRYSLSSNPDLTLDVVDAFRAAKKPLYVLGVVHPDLPFLGGEAEVGADFFDQILEASPSTPKLFALPSTPVSAVEHSIGFLASQLIVDDGTIQIGIGSLSDAIVAALILRHKNNSDYQHLQAQLPPFDIALSNETFQIGLYGLSEMINDGFMHLRKAGILKRCVVDERAKQETYLHGAFFLGTRRFYDWLNRLEGADFSGLRMGRVSKINDLYDPHEVVLRHQRKNPRFLNTCMQVTLLGAAASDTIESGRVVSGVGGQYNFVAMSHELKNSMSILMLRSTRKERGVVTSNIVWSHGQATIPRHLRDIFVTEYGIANVRGKSDEETIKALLNITDSRFQSPLLAEAKRNRKIASHYEIPATFRNNNPEKVKQFIDEGKKFGTFATFPLGSDFTLEEERLMPALSHLQKMKSWERLSAFFTQINQYPRELERLDLTKPRTLKQHIYRRLVCRALDVTNRKGLY